MATLAPIEMLDWLAQQQFLSTSQVEELRPRLASFADSHALAKELIQRNWLTPFQVNQVLQGKQDQLILGAYRLRERLGEGAMGQIYKAWHLRLERIVAIKTIHKEYVSSPKAMDRFRREIEAASKLDHPNIALVLDAGEADGRPYLVMDFIDGFNLSLRVKQQGALPIPEAVEYARQAALGLQHAHERGIVHRDIKPSNLMVATTRSGEPAPLLKILDFGLARFEAEQDSGPRLTQVGNLLGTVDYVAPEQAQNARTADIRADIYSLGCSLYFLLTGQPPFQGTTVVEKLGPRLTGEPPRARPLRAEVPEALDALLCRLMARRPEDRLQTPIEVAQALEPFAAAPPAPTASLLPGVMMAQPVSAAAAIRGGVPLATPIVATPIVATPIPATPIPATPIQPTAVKEEKPTAAEDPAFLGMTATGRDMSTGSAAAAPPVAKPGRSFPLKVAVMLGGGALLLFFTACIALCLLSGYFSGPTEKTATGSIRIRDAKFSTPSQTIKEGSTKRILVYIERINCRHPVKLTLADLPEDVQAKTGLIAPNALEGDVSFTVSYGAELVETPIRVIAVSDKDGARAEKTLMLRIVK